MPTYETAADLRSAVEKRRGKKFDDERWDSLSVDWSPPYDDADLRELLLASADDNESAFVEDCERLGQIISYELETAHRTIRDHAVVLEASGFSYRPLGEFWAWSWFYANQTERAALTRRAYDGYSGARKEDEISYDGAFKYDPPANKTVLYMWEFFWKSVDFLSKRYSRSALIAAAGLFWPDHFDGWTVKPLFPENSAKRNAMIERLSEASTLTPQALRDHMENQIRKASMAFREAQQSFAIRDPMKFLLVRVASLSAKGMTWEQKRQLYERMRLDYPLGKTRVIESWRQFAVETKRAIKAFELHQMARPQRYDLIYDMGPRWYMADGRPQARPEVNTN